MTDDETFSVSDEHLKNPTRNSDGSIDVIFTHPTLGDVPYTSRDNDDGPFGPQIWEALKDRGDIAPYEPPPPVIPAEVTKLQLVRALRQLGHWDAVKAALAATDADTQEDWALANTIPRNDPLIAMVAAGLGSADADIDAAFILAVTL